MCLIQFWSYIDKLPTYIDNSSYITYVNVINSHLHTFQSYNVVKEICGVALFSLSSDV